DIDNSTTVLNRLLENAVPADAALTEHESTIRSTDDETMPNVPSTIPATRRRIITWILSILVPLAAGLIAGVIWLWPAGAPPDLSLEDPYATTESFSVVSGSVSSVLARECDGGAESRSPTQAQQTLQCQTVQV